MNNDSPKQIIQQKKEKSDNNQSSQIIKYNLIIERKSKPEFDLNLSDYFKLLKHKRGSDVIKRKGQKMTNKKGEINKSHKSISRKSNKSNKSKKSSKISKNKSKSQSNKSIEKNKNKSSDSRLEKIENLENISKIELDKNENDIEENKLKDLELKTLNENMSQKIFNKRLIKQKSEKLKIPSTNNTTIKKTTIKKLMRNISCKNFNNSKLKKNYDLNNSKIKNTENDEVTHDIGKYLVSTKYFEKVKFNKYKYYNDRNNFYIESRRQRIDDYFNKIIYEKYKILKPLRMTQRIFYKEENNKIYTEQNDINIANNLFYSDDNRKNNTFKNINKYLFNESSNFNRYDKKNTINKNLKMYYQKIKQLSDTRNDLLTKEFFMRKDYGLLDFNFSFLNKRYKSKKNN